MSKARVGVQDSRNPLPGWDGLLGGRPEKVQKLFGSGGRGGQGAGPVGTGVTHIKPPPPNG